MLRFDHGGDWSAMFVRYDLDATDKKNILQGKSVDLYGKVEVDMVMKDGHCYELNRVESFSEIDDQLEFSVFELVEVPCPPGYGTVNPGGSGSGGYTGYIGVWDPGSIYNPDPVYPIGGGSGGGPSGGGPYPYGPVDIVTLPVLPLSPFVAELTDEQRAFWFYPQNAAIIADIEKFLSKNNHTEEAEAFAQQLIEALMIEPPVTYTNADFPGKDEGMPFEWWRDNSYIKNNLIILPDNPLAPAEGPNWKELLLIKFFPAQAVVIFANAETAKNRTQQLINVYPGPYNGKADAFRHCFWNALSAADIGVFY